MKQELLKPKVDVVFHALFREENRGLTEGLISDILGEKVKLISSNRDRHVQIKSPEQKLGVMDLRTELEGGIKCNIEIQLARQKFEKERILYYWADAYTRQLSRGEEYEQLKKTISIIIVDHEIELLRNLNNLGVKWQIRDNETGKQLLTNRLEIVIISIPKAKRVYQQNDKDKIGQWMIFFDDPNKKEVNNIVKENETIKDAIIELTEMSDDYELRRIAELREKGRRDRVAEIQYAIDEGMEKGIKEGIKEGMKEGKKEGRKEGEYKEKLRIAKNLLKEGVDINTIKKVTGLTLKEIEE